MSETKHRNLREWVTELRPHAPWFLLTLIGSAFALAVVSWIPDPIVRTILIGLGLCANASLIAWLSWLRTRDNKANTRELTALLERMEQLQKASVNIGGTRQQRAQRQQQEQARQQQEQPRQRTSGLENSHPDVLRFQPDAVKRPDVANLSSGTDFDLATDRRFGIGEQDAHKQWKLLNTAEKAMVGFVLQRGTVTATLLLRFRNPEGSRSTDTCAGVREKTSFLLGDLENGLTINPQLKPYLEKIVQDKGSSRF